MPPTDSNPPPPKKPIQVAKLLPPKAAGTPPKPKPKPKPAPPADDGGFEVVDDDADTASTKSAATESGFDVVDDDPPPKPKKKKPKVVVEDDEPASGWGGDDDDDDRPRKKKKKRRRDIAEEGPDTSRERDNQIMEWGIPAFLTLLGIVFTIVAAVLISAKNKEVGAAAGVGILLIASVIYTIITIPVTIVALMVIGGVMGIEYGTLTNAVRSLTAITVLINGIYFLGGAFEFFGIFAAPAIASLVTFALFMSLFKLDPAETWISLMGLNIIAFVGNILFFVLVAMLAAKASSKLGNDADFDPGPGFNDPAGKNFNPGGGGGGRNKRPFDPDDDDDN